MKKLLKGLVLSLSLVLSATSLVWTGMQHSRFENLTYQTNLQFPRNLISRIDMFSDDRQVGLCSGVIIKDGLVLTAAHCGAEGIDKLKVDGKLATVIKKDTSVDLMLLGVEGVMCSPNCPPIKLNNVRIDAKVVTIGYPLGYEKVATEGRVEGYGPTKESKHYMLITSPVIFGNSGGGVFEVVDGQWVLVGIESAVSQHCQESFFSINCSPITHLGLAVNAEAINEFLNGVGN